MMDYAEKLASSCLGLSEIWILSVFLLPGFSGVNLLEATTATLPDDDRYDCVEA